LDGSSCCPCAKVNCVYTQMRNKEYQHSEFMKVKAIRNIARGEELYVSYGNNYWSFYYFFIFS
jgi:hypothetical protein